MSQPITDLIKLSKFDLMNLNADIMFSDSTGELLEDLATTIFSSSSDSNFVILVGDQGSEEYLIRQLSISSCFIERYQPSGNLISRMDAAIPSETTLFIWNYFSIPYSKLPEIVQKNWKRVVIYALYLDWIPDDIPLLSPFED
jgi:hypothetical protein